MKILIVVTGGLMSDGISLGTIGYFKSMEKEGMEVDFLAVNDVDENIVKKIKEAGCNIIKVEGRRNKTAKYCYKLYKLMKQKKYDIVHAHGSSSIITIEMMIAKFADIKIRIAHSRNTTCDNKKIDKILRPLFYKVTTDYFACGNKAGEWLFEKNNFTIIPNAKDIKLFEFSKEMRNQVREKYKINNKLTICHIGKFNYQKNHDFLIDIFYEVKKINGNTCLLLVGDGELKQSINKKIEKLGLKDDVIMIGEINNVNELIQGMDILVMPSRYEGLPNVVIEAQISGLACVISENITDECKITELVEFESLEASSKIWAERILNKQLIDRECYKEMIINQIRVSGYDIKKAAQNLKDIYFNLYKQEHLKNITEDGENSEKEDSVCC